MLDCKALYYPRPILKTALKLRTLPQGTMLEVHADGISFPAQRREWCKATGRPLINLTEADRHVVATLRS